MLDYPRLLALLRLSDGDVVAAVRIGSRVYGTARELSDEDFAVVLARDDRPRDLVFAAPGVDVVTWGRAAFVEALRAQSLLALECLFAPAPHVLKAARVPYALDRKRLARAVGARSDADWKKGLRRLADEPAASRKRLFHALRGPTFARQLIAARAITDFTAANAHHALIATGPDDDPAWYEARLGPIRDALLADL